MYHHLLRLKKFFLAVLLKYTNKQNKEFEEYKLGSAKIFNSDDENYDRPHSYLSCYLYETYFDELLVEFVCKSDYFCEIEIENYKELYLNYLKEILCVL